MRALRPFFLVVDLGFIAYWVVTALGVIPADLLFKDYHDPALVAWNWSFLPLDLAISATGLYALWLYRRGQAEWRPLALVSLVLTSCSGLMAVAFWGIQFDFDPWWWGPNLFLLLYPLYFIPKLICDDVADRLVPGAV